VPRKPPTVNEPKRPPLRPDEPAPAFLGYQTLPSALGTDSPITGKLNFSAPTRIDGVLQGEVRATDLLVIGETGSVTGTLRAPRLVVLGLVRGEVKGAQRIEVGPRGRLYATVETETLIVQDGGIFEGRCRMWGSGGEPREPSSGSSPKT